MHVVLLHDGWSIEREGIAYCASLSGELEIITPFRAYQPKRPALSNATVALAMDAHLQPESSCRGIRSGEFDLLSDIASPSGLGIVSGCNTEGSILLAAEYGGYWTRAFVSNIVGGAKIRWQRRERDHEVNLETVSILAHMPAGSEVHIDLNGYGYRSGNDCVCLRWDSGILTESRVNGRETPSYDYEIIQWQDSENSRRQASY